MSQLRIASINIERSKHLHRVEKFLNWYAPDVLCLQEVVQDDIPQLEDILGNTRPYAHLGVHPQAGNGSVGVAIGAWANLEDVATHHYGTTTESSTGVDMHEKAIFATCQGFRIGTTHVRVTHHGESTPDQRETVTKLITFAKDEPARAGGLLLCGDFNSPRGGATFDILAGNFSDGVPASYTTSIDGSLHAAGQLPYMVDGLFHTPSYKLEDATLHTGVSDHCALTCTLKKATT